MKQEKIDRINYLVKKSKTEGLTEAEAAEQKALRDEYRASFRASFANIMDNTVIQYPDGTKKPVTRNTNAKC